MKIIMSLEELMYINKAVNGVKSEILKIDPNTEIDWPIEETNKQFGLCRGR